MNEWIKNKFAFLALNIFLFLYLHQIKIKKKNRKMNRVMQSYNKVWILNRGAANESEINAILFKNMNHNNYEINIHANKIWNTI